MTVFVSDRWLLKSFIVSPVADTNVIEEPLPPNCVLQHPKYQHLIILDVGNSAQVHAAFLVHLDLAELKCKDVSCVGCSELRLVLPEGREKVGKAQTVPPLPEHRGLSHRNMRSVLVRGSTMLLYVVAPDSSLVYQRMCDGLLTPLLTVGIQDQGRRQHRKRRQQE
ncbi:tRNA-splicing endonuclease subunit Sen15-like [Salvelinus fontinalis]|uniref:tRNA-splicing endonuclease subunit Sen15-like n=1 Tax=Salvelinus fontinalis TaxID=8038 RepID=UPI0024854933|nr:tRNA-splicing endonuclease subunit Sen15-like [Salvelinus fontinalis]